VTARYAERRAPRVVGTLLEGPCARMPWYTDLRAVFGVLGGREREFDWLVTDLECVPFPPELSPEKEAQLFSGEALSDLVRGQSVPTQLIWAVLTGFERGTSPDLSNLCLLPGADGNSDLWPGEPRIQYPRAVVELVCWDSSATMLITSDSDLTARFRAGFPEAVDLATSARARR